VARIFITFGLIATLTVCVSAQDAQPAQATSTISGTVVDALTNQPLKAANVWVRSFQPGQVGRRISSATTDAEGHFTLEGLAPGRYFVSASREDYVGQRGGGNASGGKSLTVAPDQHINDVVIQLTPGATINGHVKNADGKPLAGASVEVMRYFTEAGRKQLHGVRPAALSNLTGEYRITGLAPGRYYLRASASATESAKSSSKQVYASAYYPGSSELARAMELAVLPGADLSGIDLTLATVATVEISGRVLIAGAPIPAANADVTLVDPDGGSFSTRNCTTDGKGNFELHNVLPGNYELLAQIEPQTKKSKTLFGSRAINVGKVNVRKVEIVIGPGTDISGRIHLDDKADDKTKIDLSRVSVDLEPEGSSAVTALMPGVDSASVNSDGSFLFTDIPEGTYWLNFSALPAGYYMKATGGLDVLESAVTVARGQSLPTLDFALSSNVAGLEGDVSNRDGPAAGASVVVVPGGARTARSRYYRQSRTDQSGRFSMRSLIPGDYKIFAFEDVERGAYLNPDFLQPFEDRGQAVHLSEGAHLSLHLEAIPASETSP
jgi:protocatechuate 3,4-dioxygenase beta subunit